MTRWLSTAAMCVALAGFGCSSEEDEPARQKPDAAARAFTTDPLPAGPSLYLRQLSLDDAELELELVGNALSDGYGVAWRLEYDPAVLAFTDTQPSSAWSPNTLHISREARPGLLVAALSAKGAASGKSWPNTVLAVVSFAVKSPNSSRIDFVTHESGIVRSDGRRATDVQLAGGELGAD